MAIRLALVIQKVMNFVQFYDDMYDMGHKQPGDTQRNDMPSVPEDTPSEETPTENNEDMATLNTPSEETPTENNEDMATHNTPSEETPDEETFDKISKQALDIAISIIQMSLDQQCKYYIS